MVFIYKSFFFTVKGLWKVANPIFHKIVKKLYCSNQQDLNKYHVMIATSLNSSTTTVRKLVEQTHHYYNGEDHFMLKQTISNIENFLFLFNPYTKYDLCRYWQRLEEKGYDPVNEYNKRLEMFDMQYSPLPKDLFVVMLQISRFLKEFAEFETKHTPQFRHPYIKGKVVMRRRGEDDFFELENKRIKIKDFLKEDDDPVQTLKNGMMNVIPRGGDFKKKGAATLREVGIDENTDNSPRPTMPDLEGDGEPNIDAELDWPFNAEAEEKELTQPDSMYDPNAGAADLSSQKIEYLKEIGLQHEIEKMKMTEKYSVKQGLLPHEDVNIEVKSGRDAFFDFFKNILKERNSRKILHTLEDLDGATIEKAKTKRQKEVTILDHSARSKAEEVSGTTNLISSNRNRPEGPKGSGSLEKFGTPVEDSSVTEEELDPVMQAMKEVDLNLEQPITPSFYYYKRWLWISFPWICLHADHRFNFSSLIRECYSSNIKYLSVQDDMMLTVRRVLSLPRLHQDRERDQT
jgi:predicted SnoaL-like aldol condensation-catalyzing enzyme